MTQIKLYRNNSPLSCLTKTLTNETVVNGKFNSEIDNITGFDLSIEYTNNIDLYNYLYIPKLKRYYYIDNYSIDSNKIITLNISIDVLMTYDDEIRAALNTLKATQVNIKQFNNPFTGKTYVLTTLI